MGGIVEVTSGRNPVKRNISLNSRGQIGPILLRDGEADTDLEQSGVPAEFAPGSLSLQGPEANGEEKARMPFPYPYPCPCPCPYPYPYPYP